MTSTTNRKSTTPQERNPEMTTTTTRKSTRSTAKVAEAAKAAATDTAERTITAAEQRGLDGMAKRAEKLHEEALKETETAKASDDIRLSARAAKAWEKANEQRAAANAKAKDLGADQPWPTDRWADTPKHIVPKAPEAKVESATPAAKSADKKASKPARQVNPNAQYKAIALKAYADSLGWETTLVVAGEQAHVKCERDGERLDAWFTNDKMDVGDFMPKFTRADGSSVTLRNISAVRQQMDPIAEDGEDDRPISGTRKVRTSNPEDRPRKRVPFNPATVDLAELQGALTGQWVAYQVGDAETETIGLVGQVIKVEENPVNPKARLAHLRLMDVHVDGIKPADKATIVPLSAFRNVVGLA